MKIILDDGTELPIEKLQSLTIEPDETLVVTVKGQISPQDLMETKAYLIDILGCQRILVVDETIESFTKLKIK